MWSRKEAFCMCFIDYEKYIFFNIFLEGLYSEGTSCQIDLLVLQVLALSQNCCVDSCDQLCNTLMSKKK